MRKAPINAPPAPLRLLLLLARLELTSQQRDNALALCRRIDDWCALTEQARQNFILPLVYRHLRRLAPAGLPAEELSRMRHASLAVVRHNLQQVAITKRLASQFLEPVGVPYLFFKGPALSARYYDDPGLRYSRDIDLLVPSEHLAQLLACLLARDYSPCEPSTLSADTESLDFVARAQSVITLVSPEGVPVEIHRHIDKTGKLLPPAQLISRAELLQVGETSLRVLPTTELFTYLCLHHTRHHWSHLHWLVDMDALQRHPSFDLPAVQTYAESRGLSTTLEACLDFYLACSNSEPWYDDRLGPHARDLLKDCLTALQGDYTTELALRECNTTSNFAYPWQVHPSQRFAWQLGRLVRRWRPSYSDYHQRPLPRDWQWLYWLTRPVRGLVKHMQRPPRP